MKRAQWLGLGLIGLILFSSSGYGEAGDTAQSIGSILNPDGSLRPGTPISGSFDAQGYRLASGPGEAPRFVAAEAGKARVATLNTDGIQAAGDEYWDDRFHGFYANSYVWAMAMSGTDIYVSSGFLCRPE